MAHSSDINHVFRTEHPARGYRGARSCKGGFRPLSFESHDLVGWWFQSVDLEVGVSVGPLTWQDATWVEFLFGAHNTRVGMLSSPSPSE